MKPEEITTEADVIVWAEGDGHDSLMIPLRNYAQLSANSGCYGEHIVVRAGGRDVRVWPMDQDDTFQECYVPGRTAADSPVTIDRINESHDICDICGENGELGSMQWLGEYSPDVGVTTLSGLQCQRCGQEREDIFVEEHRAADERAMAREAEYIASRGVRK